MKKTVRKTESGYPLMRYLSLLLVVALLFSGVTFARYALERNGSVNTGVALFDASYTVDGVNSLTFGNQSYWMDYSNQWYAQGEGSARTVRIGMQNKSDVKVRANVLHMEGPAEFWENIALQLTTVKSNSSSDSSSDNPDGVAADQIITTQYVLADFLRVRQGGTTVDNETHGYTYEDYIDWDTQTPNKVDENTQGGTFDTVFSDEFDQRDSVEETFSMSGGITAEGLKQTDTTTGKTTYDLSKVTNFEGSVTAVRQSARDTADSPEKPAFSGQDLTITITASMQPVNYSVGFARSQNERSLPVFYLDCKKEVPYYSIDITLPETNYFNMVAGNGTTSVIAFLTWTNSSGSSDLSTRVSQKDWETIAPAGDSQDGTQDGTQDDTQGGTQDDTQDGTQGGTQDGTQGGTFNEAQVTGYHFNYTDVPAQRNKEAITTTVRMNYSYANGGITSWEHVASISSGDGVYAHDIVDSNGKIVILGTVPAGSEEKMVEIAIDSTYQCSGENRVTITASALSQCNSSYNPLEFEMVQGDSFSFATEKGYEVRFSVSFVQASEQP